MKIIFVFYKPFFLSTSLLFLKSNRRTSSSRTAFWITKSFHFYTQKSKLFSLNHLPNSSWHQNPKNLSEASSWEINNRKGSLSLHPEFQKDQVKLISWMKVKLKVKKSLSSEGQGRKILVMWISHRLKVPCSNTLISPY